MTLPYGAEKFTFREQIISYLEGLSKKNEVQPKFMKYFLRSHAYYLGSQIWDALQTVVASATDCMAWFQGLAKFCINQGLPLQWFTPSDFAAFQDNRVYKSTRIETSLHGKRHWHTFRELTTELDAHEQEKGIAPKNRWNTNRPGVIITEAAQGHAIENWMRIERLESCTVKSRTPELRVHRGAQHLKAATHAGSRGQVRSFTVFPA